MAVPIVLVVLLGLIRPPTTMFMLLNAEDTVQGWTDVDQIAPVFLLVVMGQEDQEYPQRWTAVDPNAFINRVVAYLEGEEDRSGSTIPQQLAKNVFLWPGQSAARKLLEAPLAELVAAELTDRRVLELYVNYAQFAPQVYGVCAASWYYFGHSSRTLSEAESAQLVGLLPSPLHVHRARGGGPEFDDDNGDGRIEEKVDAGFTSAKGVWHAAHKARGWIADMGGFDETGRSPVLSHMGIAAPDDLPPDRLDPCAEPPEGLLTIR